MSLREVKYLFLVSGKNWERALGQSYSRDCKRFARNGSVEKAGGGRQKDER